MRTADPANSFSDILRICKQSSDPAPKTFYFLLNIWFKTFGYTDFSARLFTAIFGIAAVPVMYLLGKQLQDKYAGLIVALLTAINYYHIYYSLDVRFYDLLFLFSALSYLFFLRSLDRNSIYNLVMYAVSTLFLMSLHYFAILIFVAQGVTWIYLYKQDIFRNYKSHIKWFLTFLLIVIAYLPFIAGLLRTLHTETAALSGNPGNYFFIDYFRAFFGFSGITVIPAATAFLFFTIVSFLFPESKIRSTTVLVLCFWILLPPALAYTRTLFSNPTMGERYFIIVLPGILTALSLGIYSIKYSGIRNAFIAFYFIACMISLIGEHRFYSSTVKDDFKGVVNFISKEEKATSFHVLSDKNWHFKYYFDQYKLHPIYIEHKNYSDSRFYLAKELYTDEKLISDTTLTRIWLISAHFANLDKMRALCSSLIASGHFGLIDSFESRDAFAKLIVRKNPNDRFFNYSVPFNPDQMTELDNEKVLVIWDGQAVLNTPGLSKGKYKMSVISKGTQASGVYPHINVFVNDLKIGDYIATPRFERKDFSFDIKTNNAVIKLQMDNDLYDPAKNEDRNLFVRSVILNKAE
jgi:hypothetical protein